MNFGSPFGEVNAFFGSGTVLFPFFLFKLFVSGSSVNRLPFKEAEISLYCVGVNIATLLQRNNGVLFFISGVRLCFPATPFPASRSMCVAIAAPKRPGFLRPALLPLNKDQTEIDWRLGNPLARIYSC
jgi:hypothetical protein